MANPIFIPVAFAENGIKNPIQKALQPNQAEQEATWEKGWGNITFIPIESGGKAPLGQDFNGVFNAISSNVIHTQNGNRYKWSQDVVDNYGGYEFGAIVQSDDGTKEFRSIIDNNSVNPNLGLAGSWIIYNGVGSIPVATSTVAGVTRVLNNLTSTDVNAALSAAQGRALNDSKVAKADVVNTLTSTETQKPLSAAQGKALNDIFNRFTVNLATDNGSFNIPMGNTGRELIVKYGSVSVAGDSNASVTFRAAFPSACLNAQATINSSSFSVVADAGCGVTWTRTGLTVRNGVSTTTNISWLAIGY